MTAAEPARPTQKQRALVWEGETRVAVREVPVPVSRPGWVAVDVAYTGICGSDLHICAGEHVRAQPGTVLGHEFVGRLAEPCGDLAVGREVFVNPMVHCGRCDACVRGLVHICERLTAVGVDYPGAIAARTVAPGHGVYPLPEGADLRVAALIEPVAVCVRAVRRSGLAVGQDVHIVGAGPIGCMLGVLAGAAGAARVTVSEPSMERAAAAESLGMHVVAAPTERGPLADVVFDASGHPSVAPQLLSWPRPGATVVVVGGYAPGTHGVDLLAMMFSEVTLVGTRIYSHEDIEASISLCAQTGRSGSAAPRSGCCRSCGPTVARGSAYWRPKAISRTADRAAGVRFRRADA